MSEPTVSVVMASYNHERFVHEAVTSVLTQTFQDFEFLVTDDGSADATADIVASFGDKRIRLMRFERNRGACVAANHALRLCRGRYIAIINSDDAFAPQKLEIQACYLDAHSEAAAVFTWTQVVDELGAPVTDASHPYYSTFDQSNRSRHAWLHTFFMQGNCLCHPSLMIRAEIYRTLGYYDERLQQLPDLDMWVRVCMRHEIHVLPERLTRFRLLSDHGNVSSPTPEVMARSIWEYRRILEHYLGLAAQDLVRVFPDGCVGLEVEDTDVPYLLARIALDTRNSVRELFGLETLHALLGGPVAARLERRFGFTTTDLLRLARDADPFNVSRVSRLGARVSELQAEIERFAQAASAAARAQPRSLLMNVLTSALRFRR